MGLRIKRDVTITWEMDEAFAKILFTIFEEYDAKGIPVKEETIAIALDSLNAAIPNITNTE